jgi:sugar phosphate isomerase/epimerase
MYMLVGAMNHPQRPVEEEIAWMAGMGLEFLDLTLEPPGAAPWQIDRPLLRRMLRDHGLAVVGHTAYYLPLGHPFESVRRGAVEAFWRCAEVFAELGARCMNIHPDPRAPMHHRAFIIERNLQSLAEIIAFCRDLDVTVMVENLPSDFNTVEEIGKLLDPLPELALHLDLGHTHLQGGANSAPAILAAYGSRLAHVHLHDNLGGTADLHLPLGAGTLDLLMSLQALRNADYDGTITLEVFAPDRDLLRFSVDKLRRLWSELALTPSCAGPIR